MPEKIKCATTDRYGQVYLLKEINPSYWMIVSAEKIGKDRLTHRVVAVGQEAYVRDRWKVFVINEKAQIATNYDAFVKRLHSPI